MSHVLCLRGLVLCFCVAVDSAATGESLETAKKDVLAALSQIMDPDFGMDIVSCGFVKELQIKEAIGQVSFGI